MKRQKKEIYVAHGNLLIAGEYFVMLGAVALALPLKYGQSLEVSDTGDDSGIVHWETKVLDQPWFKADFSGNDYSILKSNDIFKAQLLQRLFIGIRSLKPALDENSIYGKITSHIQFSPEWGWGSSSSLVVNLAKWTGTDPYQLNRLVSAGSGYDIAASGSTTPILYSIKGGNHVVTPVHFNPPFRNSIYFVYLGSKQSSAEAIKEHLVKFRKNKALTDVIGSLSEKIAVSCNLLDFMELIKEHESVISGVLNSKTIQELYFNNFRGVVKSLGAWGGDFAMAASNESSEYVYQYFTKKGLDIVFTFGELVTRENLIIESIAQC
jgi:mevalonate kinase